MERLAKLASPDRARAEQCRYLPRTSSGKRRLCEAGFSGARSAPAQSEERSDEVSMPDTAHAEPLNYAAGWIAEGHPNTGNR